MSGGSYDYMYSEMEEGELHKFERGHAQLLADLELLLAQLQAGVIESFVQHPEHPTSAKGVPYLYPADAAVALPAIMARLRETVRLVEAAQAAVKEIASVAHDVEWWRSCDYSAGQAVDGCVDWMRKRLGLPPVPNPFDPATRSPS